MAEDVGKDGRGIEHIDKAQIERRQTETNEIGRAVVADHAPRYQRLHHRITFGVREGNLAPALLRITRRRESEAEARPLLVQQLDEEIGERYALGTQVRQIDLGPEIERRIERRHRQYRRRTAEIAQDTLGGRIVRHEGE